MISSIATGRVMMCVCVVSFSFGSEPGVPKSRHVVFFLPRCPHRVSRIDIKNTCRQNHMLVAILMEILLPEETRAGAQGLFTAQTNIDTDRQTHTQTHRHTDTHTHTHTSRHAPTPADEHA